MPTRSWICLNRRCVAEFDATDNNPACPNCGGVRCKWVPKPVNIARGVATRVDRDVQGLAEDYNLTNFNSPQRGRKAAMTPASTAQTHTFAPKSMPGWAGALPVDPQTGAIQPACVTTGVKAKLAGGPLIDKKHPATMAEMTPQIQASWKPDGGVRGAVERLPK